MRKILLLEQVGNELMESATPGQELMAGASRLAAVHLDTHLAQLLHDVTALDEVVGTPVHVHIMYLLVELISIGENAVVGGLHVEAEDGAAEGSEPSELIEILKHNVERLVTTP